MITAPTGRPRQRPFSIPTLKNGRRRRRRLKDIRTHNQDHQIPSISYTPLSQVARCASLALTDTEEIEGAMIGRLFAAKMAVAGLTIVGSSMVAAYFAQSTADDTNSSPRYLPEYNAAGELLLPKNFHE